MVDSDFLNRFKTSRPTVVNSSSLSVFGWPFFKGGSFCLGGLHVLGDEEEGLLPLAIVAENERREPVKKD